MEFYSEARFGNWINRIAETELKEEEPESFAVFDQMLEDVVIACLNMIRAVKEREIKKADAIKEIEKIMGILPNSDFGDELKNELFQFTMESVRAVLQSFKLYFEGKTSMKSFEALLNDALMSEKKGDYGAALEAVAKMGVKVIKGEQLPDLEIPEDSAIISWIDGIDAINSVLELSRIDVSTE
jgi:hypothetical protein